MPETIQCPKCGTEIEVAEALSAGIAAQLRTEILAEAATRESALDEREAQLKEQAANVEAAVAARVEAEREELREKARAQAREETTAELATLNEELKVSKEALAEARKAQAAFKKRERELADREAAIDLAVEERLGAQVEEARRTAREQALKDAGKQAAADREALVEARSQIAEQEAQLADARKSQAALLKQQRELKQKADELDLEIERRLNEEAGKIREETLVTVQEAQRLKDKEKDEQIEGLRRRIDELKQKAEQGSQQLQGEAQELVLEEILRSAFPHDTIEPVAKGVHGGDALQHVHDPSGGECGTILWESKRTRDWSKTWLPKLRDDRGAAKATVAVIASQALPAGCAHFDRIGDVWVTGWPYVVPLATALRSELIQVAAAKLAVTGQHGKMEMLYGYLAGPVFRNRVSGMVEAFKALKDDLEAEKRATLRLWAKREQQLVRATAASSGFYGDLQGIIGASLPEIPTLSVPLLAEETEAAEPQTGEMEGGVPGTAGRDTASLSDRHLSASHLDRVLDYLQGSRGGQSKAEILAATRIPDAVWPSLALELAAHPQVAKTGEKRGTKYIWKGGA